MSTARTLRTPKLDLANDERQALRRAHLRLVDLVKCEPDELCRATAGAFDAERAGEVVALARLQQLPSVGPATAGDLVRLGYREPAQLVGADALELMRRLEAMTGPQDPCVEDVFRCAIAHAEAPDQPERPWWEWSRERLGRKAPGRDA